MSLVLGVLAVVQPDRPHLIFRKHQKRPIMFRGMKSFSARTGILATLTTALVFFCPAQFAMAQLPAPAQTQTRRLILKDGSSHSFTNNEIHRERVRYFSPQPCKS